MKRILSILFQFLLMLIVFFIGSILPVFNILPMWSVSIGPARIFVLDGLFVLIFLYILFLLLAALRRRLPHAAINSTIAFLLALVIGLLSRFPFKSI